MGGSAKLSVEASSGDTDALHFHLTVATALGSYILYPPGSALGRDVGSQGGASWGEVV